MSSFVFARATYDPPTGQLAQQGCDYSVPVDPQRSNPTYQCLTSDEWNTQQAARAEQRAIQSQQRQEWWAGHWKQVVVGIPLGLLALFVLICVIALVADSINKKRHPEQYDALGFKKGYYW